MFQNIYGTSGHDSRTIDQPKVVGCKWVFIVKQTPEGNVEWYKARLGAKWYNQTYGIGYDETFAPVAKMSTVRTSISLAMNSG
jgi:Reverse transcriptase (RNA-dependent DNA polymerase)